MGSSVTCTMNCNHSIRALLNTLHKCDNININNKNRQKERKALKWTRHTDKIGNNRTASSAVTNKIQTVI